jgi:hypothetical protein
MDPALTTTAGLAGFVSPAKQSNTLFSCPYFLITTFSPPYITQLTAQVLSMAQDRDVPDSSILALVNCTGLSARLFATPDEQARLYPIRGQTVLVKGEATAARTFTGLVVSGDATEEELAYVIPRPGSGTTILGGCKQAHNSDATGKSSMNPPLAPEPFKFSSYKLPQSLPRGIKTSKKY